MQKKSFFKVYSEIKQRKEYVNELLLKLQNEIKDLEKTLYKEKNLNYASEIERLEEMKQFLLDYPAYFSNFKLIGLRHLLKNALNTILSIFMIAFFIGLFIMFKVGFSLNILMLSFGTSSLIVLYNIFVAPFVDDYIRKKYVLDKYNSIDNIDLEIGKTKEKQKELLENINNLEEKLKTKKEKEENLVSYNERLNTLETNIFLQIENYADEILSDLAHDYYIYEDSSLKLINKKNRF